MGNSCKVAVNFITPTTVAISNKDKKESSKSDQVNDNVDNVDNNNIGDVSKNNDDVENSNVTDVTRIDLSGDTLDQTIEMDDETTRDTSILPSASDMNNKQDKSGSADTTSTTNEEETTKAVVKEENNDETEDVNGDDESSVNGASHADSTESPANDATESDTGANDALELIPSTNDALESVFSANDELESVSSANDELESVSSANDALESVSSINDVLESVSRANDATESVSGESTDTWSYLLSTVDANRVNGNAESSKEVKDTTSFDDDENTSPNDVEDRTLPNDVENTTLHNDVEKTLTKVVENDVISMKTYVNYKLSSSRDIDDFFDLGETLGDGNFAVVKFAKEKATNTNCALKIIDVSKISGKEEMVKNEILVQRECFHPNLVRLFHDFHSATEIYLAMELVTGGDLFDMIAEEKVLDEDVAMRYTRDMCSGLDYLHCRNIVHRDIKPENLMLSIASDGTISLKLADFGLAQEVTEPLLMYCGTPTYLAPEILKEDGYGLEVDVWAAGVIVYIMLCGFPPFRSTHGKPSELFDLVEAGEFEFLPPYWDDVTDTAKDLIKHILVVGVKNRYTCKDILSHVWITQYGL